MSGQMPPTGQSGSGVPGGAQAGQPSEEEIREYVTQMRGAHVEQVVAEVLQGLLNAAQVKLGRHDGRLLIDMAGTLAEQARPHLSDDVAGQIDQALSQLRMGQVEAEKEIQSAREQGEDVSEPNDLDTVPPEPTQESAQRQAAESGGAERDAGGEPGSTAGSKLWTPGS